MTSGRFHGRVEGRQRDCAHTGCPEAGDFRAPAEAGRATSANGPGDWQWFCLEHVRAFNARYDYFKGMSADEIEEAQHPAAGWATESRAFTGAGVDAPPAWTNFIDPLEAISGRFRGKIKDRMPQEREDRIPLSTSERDALNLLSLDLNVGKAEIRKRYTALARELHPDRNGGDRSKEMRLQRVVEAYQLLRKSQIFR